MLKPSLNDLMLQLQRRTRASQLFLKYVAGSRVPWRVIVNTSVIQHEVPDCQASTPEQALQMAIARFDASTPERPFLSSW